MKLKVKDATKPLQFRITMEHHRAALEAAEKDAKEGGSARGEHCVIAQALTNALGGSFFSASSVHDARTRAPSPGTRYL